MRKILLSLMVIVVVAASLTTGAMALFTDQKTVDENVFTTGTVILGIDPATAMFTVSGMAPGDMVSEDLEVSNDGSLELRYAMTTDAVLDSDPSLATQLQVVITDAADNELYSGPLIDAAIGDRVLVAGDDEVLTFTVTLPLETGNDYQGATCTVEFGFVGEQTANNP